MSDDLNAELFALLDDERALDAFWFPSEEEDLAPVSVVSDGEGGEIAVFADGSWCTTVDGRPV